MTDYGPPDGDSPRAGCGLSLLVGALFWLALVAALAALNYTV